MSTVLQYPSALYLNNAKKINMKSLLLLIAVVSVIVLLVELVYNVYVDVVMFLIMILYIGV